MLQANTKAKRIVLAVAGAALLVFAVCFLESRDGPTAPPRKAELAKEVVQKIVNGDYAGALQYFDSQMLAVTSEADVQAKWEMLTAHSGAFQGIVGVSPGEDGGLDTVCVVAQYETCAIKTLVVFDADEKVLSMNWETVPVAGNAPPPPYASPDQFTEREVTVGNGDLALPGTLSTPKGNGPYPAVVLVHGSGPMDRDCTTGPNKPFRDMAWGLAARGIVVLRYDKRTFAHPDKVAPLLVPGSPFTVKDEVIDDAVAAVNALRQEKCVDPKRVFVLGFSFGGMLAPRIGERDHSIAGLIVVNGPTRRITDVLLDQVRYTTGLDGVHSEAEKRQLKQVRSEAAAIDDPGLKPDSRTVLAGKCPAGYWLDLRDYKPAELARTVGMPMLIIQGGRDYQVTDADFAGWKRALGARRDVVFKYYPNLSHALIAGEGQAVPAELGSVHHPDVIVIDDIAKWIKS